MSPMPLRPPASFAPRPRRRGRAAVVLALVVGLLFVGLLFAALLAPSVPTATSAPTLMTLSTVAGPGEIKITVSHSDDRRQTEFLGLLDGLVKQSLASGVGISESGRSGQVLGGLGGSLYSGESRFLLAAADPQAVIGPWFDFDTFVENANFLCRPLFDTVEDQTSLACTVEHTPIDGGATLSSRVVRTDGTLRFETPLAR
jgi:hypothetical protein